MADAPLTAGALTPPAASQDVAFSDVLLFHFTDADPNATAGQYTAVITWGDGNTSTVTGTAGAYGQIVADAGGFDVLGSYLYTQQLSGATFSVQVTDQGGATTGASDTSFSVAAPPLTAGALAPPAAIAGIGFSDALLFQFSDANSADRAANFSAVITWGDGNTSTVTSTAGAYGQIVADAGGFDVLGSYLYTQQLSGATFSVQVTEQDGASTGASQGNFSVGNTVTSTVATSSLALANDASIIIAAGGSLTVTDAATLSSGATVVVEDGGTLVVSALSLGSGTGGVTFDGGALQASGDLTTAVPISIGAGGATIDTNGFNVTLSGDLSGDSGSGVLTETGGGTLTLSGSSTYTGGTVVSSGTLVVSSPSTLSSSGQLNVGRSGVVSLLGLLTIPSGGDAAPATTTAATSSTTSAATSVTTSDTTTAPTTAATPPATSPATTSTAGAATTTTTTAPTTSATTAATTTTTTAPTTSATTATTAVVPTVATSVSGSAGRAPTAKVATPTVVKAVTVVVVPRPVSGKGVSLPQPVVVASRSAVGASGASTTAGAKTGGSTASVTAGQTNAHSAVSQPSQVATAAAKATSPSAAASSGVTQRTAQTAVTAAGLIDRALVALLG